VKGKMCAASVKTGKGVVVFFRAFACNLWDSSPRPPWRADALLVFSKGLHCGCASDRLDSYGKKEELGSVLAVQGCMTMFFRHHHSFSSWKSFRTNYLNT